jgi:hypothetical protein
MAHEHYYVFGFIFGVGNLYYCFEWIDAMSNYKTLMDLVMNLVGAIIGVSFISRYNK